MLPEAVPASERWAFHHSRSASDFTRRPVREIEWAPRNSPSWPTPPSTTPPAPPAARQAGFRKSGGIGSTEGMGICHSYTPDGRCVSLLKILLTNFCIYDCAYCVNRVSSNVPRARFTTDEVVDLTLGFYKRNYIEGLFLSSGIIRSGDYTMEQMVEVARSLREDHRFRGYIHLKTIPEASPELLARGRALRRPAQSSTSNCPTEPA
jgi:hypothetical protein